MAGFVARVTLLALSGGTLSLLVLDVLALSWLPALLHSAPCSFLARVLWRAYREVDVEEEGEA